MQKTWQVALNLQDNEKEVKGRAGVVGDHTPTLNSELSYLMLESL